MTEIAKIENRALTPITPMDLLQKATESGADLDKLEKLMDLQERWEKNEARKLYVRAMSTFREKCPSIAREKKSHNAKYAGLADTLDVIKGLLCECGLSHSWRTGQEGNNISVTCIVTHVDGHFEETTLFAAPDNSGSKQPIQAIGSTISYLERYTLYAVLGLASKEMDDDGNGPTEYITIEQVNELLDLNSKRGNKPEEFCNYLKIGALSELPKSRFNEAIQAVKAKAST